MIHISCFVWSRASYLIWGRRRSRENAFKLHCLYRPRCVQGGSAAPKVSHLRTSTDRSSSLFPLMAAWLIGYGLSLWNWKWNWSKMTAPLDYIRCSFLKVPYGNCQSWGCLRGTLHILFHLPCLLLWMRCNVVAKCISTSPLWQKLSDHHQGK